MPNYSKCSCPEKPLCELCLDMGYHEPAIGSFWLPAWWPRREKFTFRCQFHAVDFNKRIPGLDPPERADDSWRPSMMDAARQACMALKREDAARDAPTDVPTGFKYENARMRSWTPAQRASMARLAAYHR